MSVFINIVTHSVHTVCEVCLIQGALFGVCELVDVFS